MQSRALQLALAARKRRARFAWDARRRKGEPTAAVSTDVGPVGSSTLTVENGDENALENCAPSELEFRRIENFFDQESVARADQFREKLDSEGLDAARQIPWPLFCKRKPREKPARAMRSRKMEQSRTKFVITTSGR